MNVFQWGVNWFHGCFLTDHLPIKKALYGISVPHHMHIIGQKNFFRPRLSPMVESLKVEIENIYLHTSLKDLIHTRYFNVMIK